MADDRRKDPFSTGAGLDVLSRLSGHGGEALIGRELGDYRITALIAEGGMSRVYRAERTDGSFERDVAIKISPAGGLSHEFRERFLREQGMLAGLNHPNICQLYDAQVTDEGWPYIVMELVEGVPVDDWCRERAEDREAVVRLMIEIADALAYAHARLIVHRDIKPSNVLVNAEGRPKLLDFGIAKLLQPDVTALTHVSPMTPRYASPEQLLGEEVTIGSDIYQLGLLFCEMLTGEAPNPDQTLADAIQRAAQGHAVSIPASQRRRFPRELLLIIEQCLRVAPEERYSDANMVKRDLEAWLRGFPVSAAGQGAGYRLRKLVARNRGTAATAALAAVAIIGGATWYTWQLREARASAQTQAEAAARQADRAGRVSEFLVDLLAAPAPENARGEVVTAREVLDRGVERLGAVTGMDAGVRSSLLLTMARSYKSLGEYGEASALIDEALGLRSGSDERSLWFAEALEEKGRILRLSGKLEEALGTLQEALGYARHDDGVEARRRRGSILDTLGVVATELDRLEEARQFYAEALELRSEILGPDHVDTLITLANLGGIYAVQDRYEEALPLYERAVATTEEALGPDHPNLPPLLDGLAASYRNTGRLDEALAVTRRSVALARTLHGPEHPEVAYTLSGLAILHGRGGDYEAAVDVTREVVDILSGALGDEHPQTAFNRLRLANYCLRLGRYDEAETLIERIRPVYADASPSMLSPRATLALVTARLYAQTGRPQAAIAEYRLAADLRAEAFGQDSPHIAGPLIESAALQAETGDLDQAAESYQSAIAILAGALGERDPEVIRHMESLATVLDRAGREEEVRRLQARIASLRPDGR